MSALLHPRPFESALRPHVSPTRPAWADDAAIGDEPDQLTFEALRKAFAASGGIARADDLRRVLSDLRQGDDVALSRLIAGGRVLHFEWQAEMWIPMAQFDLRDLSLKPGLQQVRAELGHRLDDWSVAIWLARPNDWLSDRRPVDLLDTETTAVLRAARADRFVCFG